MDAKLNTNRRVAPEHQRLEAPTGGAARSSVYEAEREGISRLAAAHSKVGEAVAACGKMLYAYDQNRVKEEYAADSRMLNVIYAEEYAALNERFRNRQFDNSQQFKDAYIAESVEVNRKVRERITKGDPAYGGFTFRNMDRWETELSQTADVQAATGMVNATQNWINKREQITMQTNDERLKVIAKIGSADDAKKTVDDMKRENPLYAPYYDAKLGTLLETIKVRDAVNSLSGVVNDLGVNARERLDVLSAGIKATRSEYADLEIKPGDSDDVRRDKLLKRRNTGKINTEAEAAKLKADYFSEMAEETAKRRKAYEQLLSDSGVDFDTREKLLYSFDRKAATEAQQAYSAYVNTVTKEQKKRTEDNRKAYVEASSSGNTSYLLMNNDFATIVDRDDHLPDIPGTQEFRFQKKVDANAEGLTAEQKQEAKWRNEFTQAKSTRNATIAINRLCALNTEDPNYFALAKDVLEDCRIGGITREDYAPVYDFFVKQFTKQKPQYQQTVGFFKDMLFSAIYNETSVLSEEDKETIKNFDQLCISGKLDTETFDFFLKVCTNAAKFGTYAEAVNYMQGTIGKFAKEADARAVNAQVQTKVQNLRSWVDPSQTFDLDPKSGAFAKVREEQFNAYKEQKRRAEEEELKRQTRPVRGSPKSLAEAINIGATTSIGI